MEQSRYRLNVTWDNPSKQLLEFIIGKGGAMPNWKEAFEWALAKGGVSCINVTFCNFCVLAGHADKGRRTGKDCSDCPLNVVNSKGTDTCASIKLDNSDRRAICRYVLKHTEDFTDRDEIREHIADALTILGKDDAREKFLGKPEPEKVRYDKTSLGSGYEWPTKFRESLRAAAGELRHVITKKGNHWPDNIIAAFRDEETRDRVLELLNGEGDGGA